jgi:hypothetical protein
LLDKAPRHREHFRFVPFFGAFGAAWDDAMVARWSDNPFGMLWPEMDAAFVTSAETGGDVVRGSLISGFETGTRPQPK